MARRKKRVSGGIAGEVAESVGASLGTFMNQVEAQVRTARTQRDAAIKGLLSVRARATALLAELGHAVSDIKLPRKRRTPPTKRGVIASAASAVKGKFKTAAERRQRGPKARRARWMPTRAKKSDK